MSKETESGASADHLLKLLDGTPVAGDEAEIQRFRDLEPKDRFMVGALLRSGEARTVSEALEDLVGRREAHAGALEARRSFRAVEGG